MREASLNWFVLKTSKTSSQKGINGRARARSTHQVIVDGDDTFSTSRVGGRVAVGWFIDQDTSLKRFSSRGTTTPSKRAFVERELRGRFAVLPFFLSPPVPLSLSQLFVFLPAIFLSRSLDTLQGCVIKYVAGQGIPYISRSRIQLTK